MRAPLPAPSRHAVIVGGGAAGFFAAITCAEANPRVRVTLLERSSQVLAKVRVSGGGRCNVTHNLFDPALLVQHYPRGGRALRGPLSRFGPRETAAWFAARGVELSAESDGRMFPVSNSAMTIVACLSEAAKDAGVEIRTGAAVTLVTKAEHGFSIALKGGDLLRCQRLLLATGSNARAYAWARALGHEIVPPVPSLFTFNVKDPRLEGLAGISVPQAHLWLAGTKLEQRGPLLVTHWGLSGPAVLKLSAWGARELHERGYRATLIVNWLPETHPEALRQTLLGLKSSEARKTVAAGSPFALPQRLWRALTGAAGISHTRRWAEVSKGELNRLAEELSRGRFEVSGKGVFKEEFVTCGGVSLDEVNFKTMASRLIPGLYFAGEILDIDGVTGGFNFQSAWATGWLAGQAMAGNETL
jgi:predicted Rossmann fold flavoprotein